MADAEAVADVISRLLDRPIHADVRTRLSEDPDGVIEQVAQAFGVANFDVVRALPAQYAAFVDGIMFEAVMEDLAKWGDVLVIVHTADIVLEVKGSIPPGSVGRGYFNIHGESPIAGHIRYERCEAIGFVARPFMGRHSASVQFFSCDGEAMFKVFVRRDEKRELDTGQLGRFNELRDRLCV